MPCATPRRCAEPPKWVPPRHLTTSPRSAAMADTMMSTITTPLQKAAAAVAATFFLVGVAGFIPGLTTNYDELEFAGHESDAMLLDIFQVSVLHNAVHLLFGVVGFALVRSWSGARLYLIGGGAAYAMVWLYG